MTIAAVANARTYDWSTWLLGIFRAFLSGGAGALVALGGSTVLKLSLRDTLVLAGSQFTVMGLYRLGEFLQLHGAPDQIQATLEVAQVKVAEAGAAIKDAKVAATTEKV